MFAYDMSNKSKCPLDSFLYLDKNIFNSFIHHHMWNDNNICAFSIPSQYLQSSKQVFFPGCGFLFFLNI